MTTLIFIRHGQSITNVSRTFTGHQDEPLSPLGQRQAQRTADWLHAHYRIDAIYASDLARTMSTARPTAQAFALPIQPDARLREIFAGAWEGMRFEQIAQVYPDVYDTWQQDIGRCVCPQGESVAQLYERVFAAVDEAAQAHAGQTVAFFTHATPIRTLQARWQQGSVQGMRDIPFVPNASVTVAQLEQGKYRLLTIGEADFLRDA